jgi:hypothetical protein
LFDVNNANSRAENNSVKAQSLSLVGQPCMQLLGIPNPFTKGLALGGERAEGSGGQVKERLL